MNEESYKKELLLKTHQHLLDAILHKGPDAENDLRLIMSPDISGAGSAKHETYSNVEEYISRVFNIEVGKMPDHINVQYLKPDVTLVGDIAIVFGLSQVKFLLDGSENSIFKRRTIVFKWLIDRWTAIHLHASEPSYQIGEGESWPLEALKARNQELKNLVEEKTSKLTQSLDNLKSTQAQLIQSAKMASLGELTAGIAHEIQNPLNFVNNFSEINTELVDELKTQLATGNLQSAIEIADSIKENEEKINRHGKRADGIVKGMLQHSRSNTGQKEPTDINALCDEYLGLAYHGLRAKDNSFNTTLKTDYDNTLANINLIPQDIGRVILNLIANAFYAVNEKKKKQTENYEPTVSISTKKINDRVEIRVGDNGNGIPSNIVDKIFQPFFTTKPTGQGTGLGLSLAYDIVKAHGGELKVVNREASPPELLLNDSVDPTGKSGGAEFIITLPL